MAYILVAVALWVLFFWFIADYERGKYYPTLLFSALLALVADLFGVTFDQWAYHGPVVGALSLWSDLGIAPAESGLFMRFYPTPFNKAAKICYFTIWSMGNALGEWLFVQQGWIVYHRWTPIRAAVFYYLYWAAVWTQEYWYNATGRLKTD